MLGFPLDQWQRDLLLADAPRLLLVTPRQAGKSTACGALAAWAMVTQPGTRVAIISPSWRQSSLLTAKTTNLLYGQRLTEESAHRIALANGSTLDCLPGDRPATVRGVTSDLLMIDEASRVRNELVTACLPMTAATDGRIIMLTTPAGASGAFYDFWSDLSDDTWSRVFVTAAEVGHYRPETLKLMRRRLGRMYAQEFEGKFLEAPGALFSSESLDELFAHRVTPWMGPLGVPDDEYIPLC
jgi:phage terminase large subunit-like protein